MIEQTTTSTINEQTPTISPLDEKLAQKREQLTQAQITKQTLIVNILKL
jgi:hypothetical protein